jgi:tight adherence protein C
MGFAALAFLVIFLLIVSGGLLLFYREAMFQRLSDIVTPRGKQGALLSAILQSGSSIGGMVGNLERILPKSAAEVSVTQKRLIRAGHREESAVNVFYGVKVLVPLTFCFLVMVSGLGHNNAFFAYAIALGLGFLAPDFWLGRRITARQKRIRIGLPDALDLLVICIEAGLSVAHPAISDELGIVVLEQRAGRARSDAWMQFAERTAVDSVRNLVSVLVQSELLGTSIARTLRVHSETLRTQRRQSVEEQAAKTTIKLIFPLVLFIFPSLFLVTLGPALIIMSESFQKYFNQ